MPIDYNLQTFRSPALQSVVADAVTFFARTPTHLLPPEEQFVGVGVYGLYYIGAHSIYAKLSDPLYGRPIYVGKAVPQGWRTSRTEVVEGTNLYRRLREHAQSINQVQDLNARDFRCRFMILNGIESDLIVPVEAELIRRYKPLWNSIVDGFGNHDPGSGRYNQARSEWDVLHPGRSWASNLTGQSPLLDDILKKIDESLKDLLP